MFGKLAGQEQGIEYGSFVSVLLCFVRVALMLK